MGENLYPDYFEKAAPLFHSFQLEIKRVLIDALVKGFFMLYYYKRLWVYWNFFIAQAVWVFNITTILGIITHDGKQYNLFSEIYFYHLDRYLKKKGYRAGIGKNNWVVQFISEEWETDSNSRSRLSL